MPEQDVMLWELWDTESGNVIDAYETEDQALAEVRTAVAQHGPDYVKAWALGYTGNDASAGEALYGSALVERAVKSVAA
jgi:ribulose bisphosphate carboxylase small subunit